MVVGAALAVVKPPTSRPIPTTIQTKGECFFDRRGPEAFRALSDILFGTGSSPGDKAVLS